MNIGEILRTLADLVDANSSPEPISRPGALSPKIMPHAEDPIEPVSSGDLAQQPDDLFVPPLQLKMELLKKAVDVESIYDEDDTEEEDRHSYPVQMGQIRRNAGLNPAVISELGDDEPLES